ncbi:MAG: LrgB family protein [Veillonella sp.]|uniref:LrgB family protein n=1 Tax=Veillonella sp. TaxID=1926307 RepID=UPI0025D1A6C6|nr:LrgB family protein [Veillonella sp.]MBS4913285.1 LrgB family protein [Veillonella sp.]
MVDYSIFQLISIHIIESLVGTVVVYFLFKKLYERSGKKLYLNPLLIVPVVIGLFLVTMQIPYETYQEGSQYISIMLQPATVAFAVPLYKFRHVVKEYAIPLVVVIGLGCAVAFLGSMGIAELFGLSPELVHSIAPRSVTTPLAIAASNTIGGNPTITAILVIATGLIGMIMTTMLVKQAHIHNRLLKGMLYGISAHGTGTAKAYEDGPKTGAIASLTMIIMGIFTTIMAPIVSYVSVLF